MPDSTPPPEPPASPLRGRPAPGRIRSVPVPMGGPSLLRASSTGYDEDMNWRRGLAVLWTLFGLIAVGEILNMAFYLLAGFAGWPGLFDVIRWGLCGGVFLALWFGWSWPRWVLAVVAFLFGLLWIVRLFAANDEALHFSLLNGQRLPGESLQNAPLLATAVLYLILAGYLAFSSDVVGFAKHRREEGRAWAVAPVFLLVGCFLIVMVSGQGVVGIWLAQQRQGANEFGQESLRAMAAHWDRATFDALCEDQFRESRPVAQRDATMAYLKPLGPLRNSRALWVTIRRRFDQGDERFVVAGSFQARAEFAAGQATIQLNLIRGLFGPWRLNAIGVENLRIDPPPAPPAPPLPDATPAVPPAPSTGG